MDYNIHLQNYGFIITLILRLLYFNIKVVAISL